MRRLFQEGLRPAVARLYDPLDSWLLGRGAVSAERAGGASRQGRRLQQDLLERIVRRVFRASSAVRTLIEQLEKSDRARSTLILVFEGTEADEVVADAERADTLCLAERGASLGPRPAERWFEHRYAISYRQSRVFRSGAFSDTLEVAAPWSSLYDVYRSVRHALGADAFVIAHFSHGYPDGSSIYFTFASSGRDDREAERVYDRLWHNGLRAALDAGATLSHHHGVGRSKAAFLDEALGGGAGVLSSVLRAWDPSGIMNPGCLLESRAIAPREGQPQSARRREISIDDVSLLASADGSTPLTEVEEALGRHGCTLGLQSPPPATMTVGHWIAQGFPGARDPWSDPVDQVLAGFEAHVGQRPVALAPAPRRAVGPDLCALFVGTGGQLGTVDRATLRVHRRGVPFARSLPYGGEREPSLSPAEQLAWQRVVDGLES
jgi:alkyldihydroxyacetonephosphate synthase